MSETKEEREKKEFWEFVKGHNRLRFELVIKELADNISEHSQVLDSGAAGLRPDSFLVEAIINRISKLYLLDNNKENLDALMDIAVGSGNVDETRIELLPQSYLDPINIKNGKFDIILSLGTLDHHEFDEIEEILRNYTSVLGKNGVIVFDFIANMYFVEKYTEKTGLKLESGHIEYFENYLEKYSPYLIGKSIRNVGLIINKKIIEYGKLFYFVTMR